MVWSCKQDRSLNTARDGDNRGNERRNGDGAKGRRRKIYAQDLPKIVAKVPRLWHSISDKILAKVLSNI